MSHLSRFLSAALVAAAALAPSASSAQEAEEQPIITFRTNIYNQYGATNSFHFVLGSTSPEYYDVDCGFGSFETEVQPYSVGTDGQITATPIQCRVSADGIVKVYGDPTKLEYIDTEGCYIDWIDMERCTNLAVIDLSHNEFSRLDLSPFTNAYAIYLTGNEFTAASPLKVGPNKPFLEILECDIIEHMDPSFNLSDYPALKVFDGYHNRGLKAIDPTGCPNLISLSLELTDVASLNVTKNPKLQRLNISETQIKEIDLSCNPNLMYLMAEHSSGTINTGYRLNKIDLTHNPYLTVLTLAGNKLPSIDISKNARLTNLNLSRNALKSLDVTGNPSLYSLNLAYNDLDFATLPFPQDTWGEYYYYRAPMACAKSYAVNTPVDFSARVLREGTFTFARAMRQPRGGNAEPLDDTAYTYADGKVTFHTTFPDSVYVEFGNTAFPDYTISSGAFMVKEASQMGVPSRIVSLTFPASMAGQEVALALGMDYATSSSPRTFMVKIGNGALTSMQCTSVTASDLNCRFTLPAGTASNTTASIWLPEGEVLTALAINGASLTSVDLSAASELRTLSITDCALRSIDLANNRCLTSLNLSGNKLTALNLTGAAGDYEKNVLLSVDASNNLIAKFDIVSTTQLRSLNLAGNRLRSMILKNYDALQHLDLSNNLIAEPLNLAYLANAITVNLANNSLSELVTVDMPRLESFNVSGNKFTIATLPWLGKVAEGVYTYAPQQPLKLVAFAPAVNLSAQNRTLAGANTQFTWKRSADGTPLVEGTDFESRNGGVRFLRTDLGKVFCEITHPAFPAFSGENVYRTTDLTVTGAPTTKVATFTTTSEGKATVVFQGHKDTALYIDWRGDGTEYIQYPVGSDIYTTYEGQQTYAGAQATVYTYESPEDISVFSIYDAPLTQFDGTPLTRVQSLGVGGAKLPDNALTLPKSNGLMELLLPDNQLSTRDFSEYTGLTALNLANNLYTTFDATPHTALQNLSLSRNQLTDVTLNNPRLWNVLLEYNQLSTLDVSRLPDLYQLIITGNNFSTIDLSAVRATLMVLGLGQNNFHFGTLPTVNDLPRLSYYTYGRQAELPVECVEGKVDLSAQAEVNGTPTQFAWYLGDITTDPETGELLGELLEGTGDDPEYTVANGVTTFHYSFDQPLRCVITNPALPNLILITRPVNVALNGISLPAVDTPASPEDSTIYNLQGIPVATPATPGLYIRGGQKIIVR